MAFTYKNITILTEKDKDEIKEFNDYEYKKMRESTDSMMTVLDKITIKRFNCEYNILKRNVKTYLFFDKSSILFTIKNQKMENIISEYIWSLIVYYNDKEEKDIERDIEIKNNYYLKLLMNTFRYKGYKYDDYKKIKKNINQLLSHLTNDILNALKKIEDYIYKENNEDIENEEDVI